MDNLLHTITLMLEGTQVTLEIFCITLVLSLPIGLLAALGRISSLKPLRLLMEFYVWIMRGTPLMLQLLFVYFALPMVGIMLPDIAAALLAFVLNYAAYFAEIFRAGIQAIDEGQMEAGRSLGMTWVQTMRYIIVPQAFKNIVPPLGNEFIALLKDSSLVSVIGFFYTHGFGIIRKLGLNWRNLSCFYLLEESRLGITIDLYGGDRRLLHFLDSGRLSLHFLHNNVVIIFEHLICKCNNLLFAYLTHHVKTVNHIFPTLI